MKAFMLVAVIACSLAITSCSSLNPTQNRELKELQAKNLEVKEKNASTAAALNVLPGIGDFYNGNVGLGIVNLLTWPYSILWAPVGGASGADEINYYASKAHVEKLEANRKKLKNNVETAFISKEIDKDQFMIANRKIDNMNLTEFDKDIDARDVIPTKFEDNSRIPTSAN